MIRHYFPKFSSVLSPRNVKHFQQRFLSFFRRKKVESPFLITRARCEDYDEIQAAMKEYFFPEEPTVMAVGLGRKHNPIFEHHVQLALEEGISIIAKCKCSGDIVGGCVNKTTCPWDADLLDRLACTLSCEATKSLYQFYAYLQRAPCLWERYCTNKYFEISQLFVREGDRGKGLGLELTRASRDLGADCGYRVIRVDATSYYTAKICDKLKMEMVFEIPYCAYTGKGPAKLPLFKPPEPHRTCKVYVDTPHSAYKK